MGYLNEHLDTSLERIVFAMFKPVEFAAFTQAWDALLRETALLNAPSDVESGSPRTGG